MNFTNNLILLKSSFKNRDILLNSFKTWVFCCIICKLEANTHFPLEMPSNGFLYWLFEFWCLLLEWDIWGFFFFFECVWYINFGQGRLLDNEIKVISVSKRILHRPKCLTEFWVLSSIKAKEQKVQEKYWQYLYEKWWNLFFKILFYHYIILNEIVLIWCVTIINQTRNIL